jgi:hypothetical protein
VPHRNARSRSRRLRRNLATTSIWLGRWSSRSVIPLSRLGLGVVAWILVGDFLIDDAYIAFRYADNLAHLGTLYFNIGEHGRFGYTNLGYVYLLASLHTVFGGMVGYETLARLLATVCWSLFGFAVVLRLLRRFSGIGLVVSSTATLVLLLVFPCALSNFYCGLETPLLAVALFLMFDRFASHAQTPGSLPFCAGLALALALRFDAPPLLAPIVLWQARAAARSGRMQSLLAIVVATGAGAGLSVTAVNVALTGYVVPLSLGHKWEPTAYLATMGSYVLLSLAVLGPLVVVSVPSPKGSRVPGTACSSTMPS